jgi:poly(3-hydroxybutyrate) depolymerase
MCSRIWKSLLFAIVLMLMVAGSLHAGLRNRVVPDLPNVGGEKRKYLLHVPESLPRAKKAPLVLAFPGGGSHAANTPRFTRFDALADREGFIVAYPESFNMHWNNTRGLSPGDECRLRTRPHFGSREVVSCRLASHICNGDIEWRFLLQSACART